MPLSTTPIRLKGQNPNYNSSLGFQNSETNFVSEARFGDRTLIKLTTRTGSPITLVAERGNILNNGIAFNGVPFSLRPENSNIIVGLADTCAKYYPQLEPKTIFRVYNHPGYTAVVGPRSDGNLDRSSNGDNYKILQLIPKPKDKGLVASELEGQTVDIEGQGSDRIMNGQYRLSGHTYMFTVPLEKPSPPNMRVNGSDGKSRVDTFLLGDPRILDVVMKMGDKANDHDRIDLNVESIKSSST